MPVSRIILAACLKVMAGLALLTAILLGLLAVLILFQEQPSAEPTRLATHGAGFLLGALACRWGARRTMPP